MPAGMNEGQQPATGSATASHTNQPSQHQQHPIANGFHNFQNPDASSAVSSIAQGGTPLPPRVPESQHVSPPSSSSSSVKKMPRLQAVVKRIGTTIATTINSATGGQPRGQRKREKDFMKAYLKKFDADEVEILRKVYKELSSRSPGSGIDKETFLQYFPLPGLWGERLFQRFDYKCIGFVDYEEFLVGIAVCCRGTKCERIHVLFQVFDLNGDGVLQREELVAMLSNLPNLDRYLQKDEGKDTDNKNQQSGDMQQQQQGSSTANTTPVQSARNSVDSKPIAFDVASDIRDLCVGVTPLNRQLTLSSQGSSELKHQQQRPQRAFESCLAEADILTSAGSRLSHTLTQFESDLATNLQSDEEWCRKNQRGGSLNTEGSIPIDFLESKSHNMFDEESFRMDYRAESDYDDDTDEEDDDDDDTDDDMYDEGMHMFEHRFSSGTEVGESGELEPGTRAADLPSLARDTTCDRSQPGVLDNKQHDGKQHDGKQHDNDSTCRRSTICSKSDGGDVFDNYALPFSPKHHDGTTLLTGQTTPEVKSVGGHVESHVEGHHTLLTRVTSTVDSGAPNSVSVRTDSHPALTRQRDSISTCSVSALTETTSGVPSHHPQRSAVDVEAFVDKIIEECEFSDCDSLTFIEFKTWLEKNDAILNMFVDCLHEEVWGLQGNALYRRTDDERERRGQRRMNEMKRGGRRNEDRSKRGLTEIRPDGFYKVKRLFTLSLTNGTSVPMAPPTSFKAGQPLGFSADGRDSNDSLMGTAHISTVPSLTKCPSQTHLTPAGSFGEADGVHHEIADSCNTSHKPVVDDDPAAFSSIKEQQSGDTGGVAGLLDVDIYPRQTREVLNCQLLDLILESHPDVDVRALKDTQNLGTSEEILACPSCRLLLVVCPRCHRRCPNLRLKNGSVVMECQGCLNNQPHEFYNCWHCNWSFAEAPEWVDQCEPVREGTLYKIGKHTHKWIARYFVLVDNLLYYYGTKEDIKPKGFFFLEGCFVTPILPSSSVSSSKSLGVNDPSHVSHCPSVDEGLKPLQSNVAVVPIPPSASSIKVGATTSSNGHYGFSIHHGGGKIPRRDLYASTEEEREAWMKTLGTAMNQQSIEETYRLGPVVGQGKFSMVYMAWTKDTNQEVAIKVIDKMKISGHEKELLRSEISILRLLRHPHVITLHEVLDSQKSMHIVMEYVPGGELYDLLQQKRRLPELHVNRIIIQLLTTVAYLHKCGIIHRDLKPENILLTGKTTDCADIKITDFGLSCICGMEEFVSHPCGTLAYVAPEVLTLKGYNHKADVWSVGVIMYFLLRGRLPFPIARSAGKASTAAQRVVTFEGPVWDNICSSAKDLLRKLLQPNPEKRISAQEALQHLWIKNPAAVISEGLPDDANQTHEARHSSAANEPKISNTNRGVDAPPIVFVKHTAVDSSVEVSSSPNGNDPKLLASSSDNLASQLLDVSASTFSVPVAASSKPSNLLTTSLPTVVSHIDGAQIPVTSSSLAPPSTVTSQPHVSSSQPNLPVPE